MALRRGSFRRKPVRGTAPADEAWPTDGAPGHCAPTHESTERGCSSHRRKGIFVGPRSLTSCVALCLACPRCRFVSYASPERSCSWFEACPLVSLSAELSGHRSFLVRRADGSSARPAAADATPPSAARRHIAVSNHTGQTRTQSIRTRLRSRVGGSGSAGAGIFGGGGATGGGRGTDRFHRGGQTPKKPAPAGRPRWQALKNASAPQVGSERDAAEDAAACARAGLGTPC